MGKVALVFAGRNGLDQFDLRISVMRIPEVSLRVREAQAILDGLEIPKIDLFNVILSSDEYFFKNLRLKSLLAAVVQVGLFDRYLKSQKRPEILVGNSNGDSAMAVAAGKMTFREMIENSQALATLRASDVVIPMVVHANPLLSGLSLTEYQAMEYRPVNQSEEAPSADSEMGACGYQFMAAGSMDLKSLVVSLHQEQSVACFVNVGPSSALSAADYLLLGNGEIESLESFELDPMLGWFGANARWPLALLAQ